jgi:hypothetical protein
MLVYQRVCNQFHHGFKGFDLYFLSLSETLKDGVWPPDDRNGDETVDLRVAYFQPRFSSIGQEGIPLVSLSCRETPCARFTVFGASSYGAIGSVGRGRAAW